MLGLLALATAAAAPHTPTLEGPKASWSLSFMSGDEPVLAALTWGDLSHLAPGTSLTLRVDGQPLATLFPDGTPVPPLSLGTLEQGAHQLQLEVTMTERAHSACDPGNPWMRVDVDLRGNQPMQTQAPSTLASSIRGRAVRIQAPTAAGMLELSGLVQSWGGHLDPTSSDRLVLETSHDPANPRGIDHEDGLTRIWGQPAVVRSLRDPRVLDRCASFPCLFPEGEVAPSTTHPQWTLGSRGFPHGILLSGRASQRVVLPSPGQVDRAKLMVAYGHSQAQQHTARFTVKSAGVPLATWSLESTPDAGRFEVEIPDWMLDDPYLVLDLEASLYDDTTTCDGTAPPWLRIDPSTTLQWEGSEGPGIAGLAQRLQQGTMSVCAAPDALASLQLGLNPAGGWVDDCVHPDLTVRSQPEPFRQTHQGDPVAEGVRALLERDGDQLRLGLPEAEVPTLPWPALRTDLAVSTPSTWSPVGTLPSRMPRPLDTLPDVPADAERHEAKVDLGLGVLGVLFVMGGGLWVWRSRGDESEWMA